jgi:hypothetical protein
LPSGPPPTLPSSSTTTPSSTPTPSSAPTPSPTPTPNPGTPSNSGSGPTLPAGAALAANACASCMLSLYYIGTKGLAQQCNVATPVGVAWDISTVFCDSSIKGGFGSLCTSLCANPCGTYNIQTAVAQAGVGFMPNANLPLCNQLCPMFKGDGRCTALDPCSCGLGAKTCVTC